ncbi:MAG: DEAD/DEAH box helicase [Planctomycetes bacterium]|nr:DEAD/DEAH box helicase [Planctomycetota bacterium]
MSQPQREPEIETFKGFQLSPFQREAIAAIRRGHNVLVSAPTGSGKTLVAEYAIELAMQAGRRCIYTAPIKALSNQKYRDFRDVPGLEVGISTGDVTINPRARLLIMTTEILRNAIFEDPAQLYDVDYVIFDEIHYMDDLERGSVWEESIIFAPAEIRFIGLSATIQNIGQFGRWIQSVRSHPLDVIEHTHRPVPLRHLLFHPAVGIFRPEHLKRTRAKAGSRRSDRGESAQASRALIDQLVATNDLPILYFCFSRRQCERKAHANLWRSLLSREERQKIEVLFNEICDLFQLQPNDGLEEMRQQIVRGIGYHHAGMLPIFKEIIERLFTSGLLKLLFTTETFALGINMPARTAIFDSLRKFDGITFDYLKTRDYMQMAGRAGRQGIDTEGTVISILDAEDLERAPVERLVSGRAEPIRSRFNLAYNTLIALRSRLGERIYEAWEKSFDAYQHHARTAKERDRNQHVQHEMIRKRLMLLEELGYLDGTEVRDRGRIALRIQGYELQVTEILFQGLLEGLSPRELGIVFVAIVFEERRGDVFTGMRGSVLGKRQIDIERTVRSVIHREAEYGLPASIKAPVFFLSAAVKAWADGMPMDELERFTSVTPGDFVRALRLAVQLMRQVRQVLGRDYELSDLLSDAIYFLNRDEVDARRQLELG